MGLKLRKFIVVESIHWTVEAENVKQAEELVKRGHGKCGLVDYDVRAELSTDMFAEKEPQA